MTAKRRRAARPRGPSRPLGPYIRLLRISKGLTQEQLAKLCDSAQNAISRIESGAIRRPNSDLLFRLADALSVTAEALHARFQPAVPVHRRRVARGPRRVA